MSLFSSIIGQPSTINVNKTNKWEDELDSIYNQISKREKFKYDMNADALYKQYAQQYENNAKLAMQDTVGQISALTGGYGNSYAETAGQAMYNQQMQGLNDRALDLYQLALNQYNAEGDRLMNIYGITADQYNTEYNKIRDEVADAQWAKAFEENQRQYNIGAAMDAAGLALDGIGLVADTALRGAGLALDATQFGASLAFDASRAAASDAQWQAAFDYQRERDAISDNRYAQELAYKYAQASGTTSTPTGDYGDGDDYSDPSDYSDDNDITNGTDMVTYDNVVEFAQNTNKEYNTNYSIPTESQFNAMKENGYKIMGQTFDSYDSMLMYFVDLLEGYYQ